MVTVQTTAAAELQSSDVQPVTHETFKPPGLTLPLCTVFIKCKGVGQGGGVWGLISQVLLGALKK